MARRVSRRSWSRAEKCRIVEEAFRPGASVADIARTHGLNANQVFNWRRRALATAAAKVKSPPSASVVPQDAMATTPSATFLPIGTVVQTDDAAMSLMPLSAASNRLTAAHPPPDERSGLIEIDLTCGTRLRVDAFVNEKALRRVLSVLKASA